MKILFTGGGTAGHVTPNVALIEQFQKDGWDCVYVGSTSGIEKEIITRLDIPYNAIASGKLRRYFDWRNFSDPLLILFGIMQSLVVCWRERPQAVFSKGGFVAVPVVLAAWMCRIPVVCHESDVTPGLANRLCFPFARKICLNFEETRQYLPAGSSGEGRVTVTGTPMRRSLLEGNAGRGKQFLGVDSSKPIVLIFGGSLGAKVINRQVRNVIVSLTEKFVIVHVTGAGNIDESLESTPRYIQKEFLLDEFGDVLAAAGLVIARAGANTIYELLVTRKPHILIPLSTRGSRGDQLENARTFKDAGYSIVIEEDELNDELFLSQVDDAFSRRLEIARRLADFKVKDSVAIICDLVKDVVEGEAA